MEFSMPILSCSSGGDDISSTKNNQCIVVDIPRVLSWSNFFWLWALKKLERVYFQSQDLNSTDRNGTDSFEKACGSTLLRSTAEKENTLFEGLARHQESSHSQADVSEEWLRRKRRVQKVLRLRTSRSAPANTKPRWTILNHCDCVSLKDTTPTSNLHSQYTKK